MISQLPVQRTSPAPRRDSWGPASGTAALLNPVPCDPGASARLQPESGTLSRPLQIGGQILRPVVPLNPVPAHQPPGVPRVPLAPESDSGRAHYFSALEAADHCDWLPLATI